MANIYGYIRVSTRDQNEDRQLIALCDLNIPEKNIFMDKQSGKDFNRPQYKRLLRKLKKDDLLYIKSISSVTRAFSELENAQLVERIRSGFSKPSRILLKVPHTTQNCAVTVCKNAKDDCAETSSMIAQKCTPNQRNKSNLKDSHLIRTTDAHLTFGEYQNVFLIAKEYRQLKADFSGLDDLIEQLSAYIQSTGKKYVDHAATLRIWAKRQRPEQKQAPGIPDYTFKEGESL